MSEKKNNETNTAEKIKILIVDDHSVIREGLMQIINRQADLLVCAEAGNIKDAVKSVKKQKIDIALVDMLLDHTTGIQVMKKITTLCPGIITLVFSISDNSEYVKQAMGAGARGYITKDEISEKIVNAIRRILKGQIYISRKLLKNLPKEEVNSLLTGRVQNYCD
jgi:DNA-binding NarL/FixJ family response regulator